MTMQFTKGNGAVQWEDRTAPGLLFERSRSPNAIPSSSGSPLAVDRTTPSRYHRAQMKSIRFDRHARRRMTQRNITQSEVEAVLHGPERIEPSIKGRRNAFGPTPNGLIRVTYLEAEHELLVVTVVRQQARRSKP